MADQSTRITNMPDVGSGSPQRVAFDLMSRIAHAEYPYGNTPPPAPREYYLALYKACRQAVY